MNDEGKTREELIEELAALRRRLTGPDNRGEDRRGDAGGGAGLSAFHEYLLESIDEGIWVADRHDRILFANSLVAKITGIPKERLTGIDVLSDRVPDRWRELQSLYRTAKKTLHRVVYESTPVQTPGGVILLSGKIVPVLADGRFDGMICTAGDVTELRQAEEALSHAEERFATAFRSSPDAVVISRESDGWIIDLNDAWETVTGYSRRESLGRKSDDLGIFIHPEQRRELVERISGQGQLQDFEMDVRHKSGELRRVSLSVGRIRLQHREYILSIMRDVTERRKVESALRESEERFRKAFLTSPDSININRADDGTYVDVNDGFLALTGFSREEVIGRTSLELDIWADPEDRRRLVEELKKHGGVTNLEARFRMKDGTTLAGLMSASILNLNGVPHILSITRNVEEMRKTQDALRDREEKYRGLFENALVGVYQSTPEGRFLSANPALARIYGYDSPEELIESITDITGQIFMDPQDRAEILRIMEAGDLLPYYEVQHRRKDGTPVWLSLHSRVVRDDGGCIVRIDGLAVDITERKRAEEELRHREEILGGIFRTTPITLCIMKNYIFQSVNQALYDAWGYSKDEIIGHTPRMMYESEEEFRRVGRDLYAGLSERGVATARTRLRRKDGEFRDAILIAAPLPSDKHIPMTIVAVQDVTEQVRVLEELQESRRQLRDIIEFLPDATLVVDRDGRVIAWNRAIESMTGIKAEEMIGRGDYEYALPFYGYRRPILIDLALHPDREMESQYTSVHRLGEILFGEAYTPNLPPGDRHLSATASVLRDSRGQIAAAIECIRDNTERKRMEERLNRAEKMEILGRLAGGVAHDLNNVLGVLTGYSELLAEKLPAGSSERRYADNILQSSIRGAAIIQDLLTLARRGVAVSEVVNLSRVASDYLRTPEFENLKMSHPDVQIRAELESETQLLNIKGSPVHLGKTVMNLVSNAVEAITGEGEVTIRTENRYLDRPIRGYDDVNEGDFVVLTVSDSGKGISARDIGKIFDPFYTKKMMGRSGTGLGLTVVWGTVKDHSGYIDVQSEEGKGSTFSLYFPVTREEPAMTGAGRIEMAACMGRGESILVIDDMKDQREVATSMLKRLGYRVEAASSGEEALELLGKKPFDLVVLDMIMDPGMDGLETYQKIIEIRPKQKAVIVSGFSESDRVRKVQELGGGAFVRKPYILEKIGSAIRGELDRKQDREDRT